MSEDKKDKLVQYDEDGVISSISSLANIGITTKDNPITSVLNFSALSTKMSEICNLYINLYWDSGLPYGLWVWRVHWVRERCVHRIGDGRAE